jgi:hypothetical protein
MASWLSENATQQEHAVVMIAPLRSEALTADVGASWRLPTLPVSSSRPPLVTRGPASARAPSAQSPPSFQQQCLRPATYLEYSAGWMSHHPLGCSPAGQFVTPVARAVSGRVDPGIAPSTRARISSRLAVRGGCFSALPRQRWGSIA